MNVLIACEESQRVCIEMRRLGHNAFSCDIQPCSGGHPEWHIQGDCIPLINGNCRFSDMTGRKHEIDGEWDLLIAHPPCTYLSKAGACRMFRNLCGEKWINYDRYTKMLEAKKFFEMMLEAAVGRIAVENPQPLEICGLPKETQVIEPYQFGDPYSKRTLLWLKGLPKLYPLIPVSQSTPFVPSNTSNHAKGMGGSKGAAKRGDDSKNRSETMPGIARNMAEQWAGKA